uniref:Uncharacterized protein n=1 Tax=Zea mays TaxID=4577 RepID=B7ZYN7_MAIZE|nr:unknown [Zea mays]
MYCTCAGSDADETRDHALDGADDGGLLEEDDVEAGPDEEAGGGADVGVDHGDGGVDVGGVGVSAVEASPAHPQDAGAGEHEQDVVWREPLPVLGEPGPDPVGGGEARDARGEVDDVAAGVVDDAPVEEEATAPDGEGADGVGEGEPERDEEHPRLEVHAAEQGAGEQDERDGGEHALEVDHGRHGIQGRDLARLDDAAAVEEVRGRREPRLAEEEALAERVAGLAPEREQLLAEGHLVAPHDPAQPHGGERVQRHERRVHGPLLLHDAAVQDHQPRHALQAHQRGRHHLPRVVALVQPVRYADARVRHVRRRHVVGGGRHLRSAARELRRRSISYWLALLAS